MVRVITEDQQRIVGIQIPPENVGSVLRSIGLMRDLREPDEIFYAVLDEGDEITLASNLKLRRGSIHSEPAIELSGADPYKFAELRELGLINEQINWKQRFFISTDETTGVEILSALIDRYPLVVAEDAATNTRTSVTEIETADPMGPTTIVDLEQWIIAADQRKSGEPCESTNEIDIRERKELVQETAGIQMRECQSKHSTTYMLTQQKATIPWNALSQRVRESQLAFDF